MGVAFGRGIRTGFFFPEKSDAPDYLTRTIRVIRQSSLRR